MAPKKTLKKAAKKKPAKKAAAPASGPQTKGRSDFTSEVFEASKAVPLGGVPAAQCDGAHAGVPASVGLQTIWKAALEETYDAKVAEAWTKNDCIKGKPSCMHLDKKLHPHVWPQQQSRKMMTLMWWHSYQPTYWTKVPSPDDGWALWSFSSGTRTRCPAEAVQSFLGDSVLAKHGLFKSEEEDVFEIGKEPVLMTILKTCPESLDKVVANLKEKEFNYDEVKTLSLLSHNGSATNADYNCITKAGIEDEVKRVANLGDVVIDKSINEPAGGRSPPPASLYDGTDKYVKVHVSGVVHWFNLRVRACRLLRHRHLGGLPNRNDDDECASPDMTMSEEERLRTAPLAWELSSTQLKESAWHIELFHHVSSLEAHEKAETDWSSFKFYEPSHAQFQV